MSISQFVKCIIGSEVVYMRLKELREDNDLRQIDIAKKLNVLQNTYSQYENGQRQIPINLLINLSEFYKTSVDYILELTDEKKPYKRRKK
ncbi:MAG: helix-turn-helix transcriptional regulator [Clostridia bacterium]|nr:helix-turn-helix transcriptional regulator [Clostridia bacterium]